MPKLAVFYLFTRRSSLARLSRLREMNPDAALIPIYGLHQDFYIPMVLDKYYFSSSKEIRLIGSLFHEINWLALSAPGVFRLSQGLNRMVGNVTSHGKLAALNSRTLEQGFGTLATDCTPIALWNLDHAIMKWFNSAGRSVDFDYLAFYEPDIYTTKPLAEVYGKYMYSYDACFSGYGVANPSWYFYNFPLGCKEATRKWLASKSLPTTLYRSLFGGNIISRRVLERLSKLGIDFSGRPYCCSEMRLPTVITALGFKVGKLDFPLFRFRPSWTEEEIKLHKEAGIFHPVKTLTDVERVKDKQLSKSQLIVG